MWLIFGQGIIMSPKLNRSQFSNKNDENAIKHRPDTNIRHDIVETSKS